MSGSSSLLSRALPVSIKLKSSRRFAAAQQFSAARAVHPLDDVARGLSSKNRYGCLIGASFWPTGGAVWTRDKTRKPGKPPLLPPDYRTFDAAFAVCRSGEWAKGPGCKQQPPQIRAGARPARRRGSRGDWGSSGRLSLMARGLCGSRAAKAAPRDADQPRRNRTLPTWRRTMRTG